MINVARHCNMALKPGSVAVELEVETQNPTEGLSIPGWIRKKEDSLRGFGSEWVSDGPQALFTLKQNLQVLCDTLNGDAYKAERECPRAGLHVHLNVGNLTPRQYWTGVTAYWVVENCLFNTFGYDRKSNLFCLRLKDAEGVLNFVQQDLRHSLPFKYINTDSIRYAGQNLNATPKFGSVEYRGMPSTTDPDQIYKWGSELYLMFSNAVAIYSSPSHILDTYIQRGADVILSSLFSSSFVEELKSHHGWREDVEQNILPLCDLAYFHSWDDWEKKIEKNALNQKINSKPALNLGAGGINTVGTIVGNGAATYTIDPATGWGAFAPQVYQAQPIPVPTWSDDEDDYLN